MPLLMSMEVDDLALRKAIESGDTDLIYVVLFHLRRTLPLADFFKIINGKSSACSLLETYCKKRDLDLLKDFYYQDDRKVDTAILKVLESYSKEVRRFQYLL